MIHRRSPPRSRRIYGFLGIAKRRCNDVGIAVTVDGRIDREGRNSLLVHGSGRSIHNTSTMLMLDLGWRIIHPNYR